MDRALLDGLSRSLVARGSRRATFAALLGAALLPPAFGAEASRRRKGTRKRKRRAQPAPTPVVAAVCYPGTDCARPGPGATTARCDFGGTFLAGANLRGAVLSASNLAGANLAGADLRGAVLKDACLAGAILLGATLDQSTVLDGAVFCGTIMPTGAIVNVDCARGSACCPTFADGGGGGGGDLDGGGGEGGDLDCPRPPRCTNPPNSDPDDGSF